MCFCICISGRPLSSWTWSGVKAHCKCLEQTSGDPSSVREVCMYSVELSLQPHPSSFFPLFFEDEVSG